MLCTFISECCGICCEQCASCERCCDNWRRLKISRSDEYSYLLAQGQAALSAPSSVRLSTTSDPGHMASPPLRGAMDRGNFNNFANSAQQNSEKDSTGAKPWRERVAVLHQTEEGFGLGASAGGGGAEAGAAGGGDTKDNGVLAPGS